MSTCSTHTARPATHRCDGCQRLLCDACVQPSHRLFLCGVCGEMAIPLAPDAARTTTQARRVGARAATYSLGEAFLYPFRGTGAMVFWVYFVLLVIFDVLPAFVPGLGCAVWLPSLIVALMVPRLLFTIVRTTAEGENELPDWPDFDFFARLADAFWYFVIFLVSAIPSGLIVYFAGVPESVLMGDGTVGEFLPLLFMVLFLGMAIHITALGAYSVFDSFWLIPRIDLHLRAHLTSIGTSLLITLLLSVLFVVSYGLQFAFAFAVPLVGPVVAVFVATYGTFTGAHLVGVFFRRHYDGLERLYVG